MYSLIVFLPLIAAALAGFFGRFIGDRASMWICCAAVVLSFALSVVAFFQVGLGGEVVHVRIMTWFRVDTLAVNWGIYVDQLTVYMLLVVTLVSAVVHIYSVGYMAHDPHKPRFFAYISFFTFAMLSLVTADNFVQMFFGWEGVGVASYLLVGFWFKRTSANNAAFKAFVVNRIGDFAFVLGIFAVFYAFDSVDFLTVFAATPEMTGQTLTFLSMELDLLTIVTLLLFVGAMGKSAQLGLHTWLPDAMEGPTPVSALIHAATMVTAGVFMCVRISPMLEFAPTTLMVITVVGATTCFFAATIGLTQYDIKRVIAYSTCSQLGYMFFAVGVSAYPAAMFHLGTHAMFKALLFLSAGSVIHAMSDEQDMRRMGGLWKHIRITYMYMWIGSLAIAGIPFFAAFYSKDFMLEAAWAAGTGVGQYAWALGVGAAILTAVYSWRLLFMTFHQEERGSPAVMAKVHESPMVMILPMGVLAVLAVFAGMLFYELLVGHHWHDYWRDSILVLASNPAMDTAHDVPMWVRLATLVAAVGGVLIAWQFYVRKRAIPSELAERNKPLHAFLFNKWYFDWLYGHVFVDPYIWISRRLWRDGDGRIIDGFGANGIARLMVSASRRAAALQSGYVYHYAFAMLIGIVAFITYYFFESGGGQ